MHKETEKKNQILLPLSILHKTLEKLREFGEKFEEGFIIWAGSEENSNLVVGEMLIPEQENTFICYFVSESEVHKINVLLNKQNLVAIAQIHSHPSNAFHSSIDDDYAILHLPYSYSIVVPNFGHIEEPITLDNFAFYKLIHNKWKKIPTKKVRKTFKLLK